MIKEIVQIVEFSSIISPSFRLLPLLFTSSMGRIEVPKGPQIFSDLTEKPILELLPRLKGFFSFKGTFSTTP
jgi:hypothetical protein